MQYGKAACLKKCVGNQPKNLLCVSESFGTSNLSATAEALYVRLAKAILGGHAARETELQVGRGKHPSVSKLQILVDACARKGIWVNLRQPSQLANLVVGVVVSI